MRGRVIVGIVAAVAGLVAIQLVPCDGSNPPVEGDVGAPGPVAEILRRSCYDCHSNETKWPWYSRVAPVSWLVARDVRVGREALNFSQWSRLGASERAEALEESWETVAEGEMPPWIYLVAHPEARIDDLERAFLREWLGQGPAMRHSAESDEGDND